MRKNKHLINVTDNGQFRDIQQLEVVVFVGNEEMRFLHGSLFASNTKLKHVRMVDNRLQAFDASTLFSSEAKLQTLSLSNNR